MDNIKNEERDLYYDLEACFGKVTAQMAFHSKF